MHEDLLYASKKERERGEREKKSYTTVSIAKRQCSHLEPIIAGSTCCGWRSLIAGMRLRPDAWCGPIYNATITRRNPRGRICILISARVSDSLSLPLFLLSRKDRCTFLEFRPHARKHAFYDTLVILPINTVFLAARSRPHRKLINREIDSLKLRSCLLTWCKYDSKNSLITVTTKKDMLPYKRTHWDFMRFLCQV